MPPLITREEALALGELEDHAAIEALVERAWQARAGALRRQHGHVLARQREVGRLRRGLRLLRAVALRRGRDADARDDGARADPRARARGRGGGRAPLLHGHPGPGAVQARLREGPRGRAARRRAHEPQALRVDRAHERRRARKALREAGIQRVHHNVETAESYYDEVSTTVRYEGAPAHDRRGPRGGPRDLRRRDPQPRRVARAARRDGLRAGRDRPDERADQPAEPAPGHEVRRPRATWTRGRRSSGSRSSA